MTDEQEREHFMKHFDNSYVAFKITYRRFKYERLDRIDRIDLDKEYYLYIDMGMEDKDKISGTGKTYKMAFDQLMVEINKR